MGATWWNGSKTILDRYGADPIRNMRTVDERRSFDEGEIMGGMLRCGRCGTRPAHPPVGRNGSALRDRGLRNPLRAGLSKLGEDEGPRTLCLATLDEEKGADEGD